MMHHEQGDGGTIRRRLIQLLEAGECGVRELSQELHQSEKEVYQHLEHVGRTVCQAGGTLIVSAPICLQCGYLFKERMRITPPGRCPRCRSTRISRPRYRIVRDARERR